MPKHDAIGTIIRIKPMRGRPTTQTVMCVRERFEPSTDLNAWKAGYERIVTAETLLAILPENEQPKQCRHNSEPQAGVDVRTRGTRESG